MTLADGRVATPRELELMGLLPPSDTTTFIIPSIGRPTLQRALDSVSGHPYLFHVDTERKGEAVVRNELIKQALTEWVSFLDDDDTIYPDYVQRLEEEIIAHPEADVIHFRSYFLHGQVLPLVPEVMWSNVGISFSVKRQVALDNPFQTEAHEDWYFLERLEQAGYNIHFSKYLTYKVRH
jgi:glycosyltransferase involved in cell wall biosynthesis